MSSTCGDLNSERFPDHGMTPSSNRAPVGLVGTGLFGSAVAERLLADGYPTVVHNRTREKAEPLLVRGAVWSENPLADCERVIFCVFTTDQVEQFFERMKSGTSIEGRIIIDASTSDPQQTIALGNRLAKEGVKYLESPFSGSSEVMRNHQATAIVSGDHDTALSCDDLWKCLAAKSFYVGPWGNAARMKLVTNLVLGLNRAALAEGLAFADAIGLQMKDALEVLLDCAAYSRIMDAKGPKMVRGDFTPQAKLSQHIKDVRLMLEEANRAGAVLPMSTTHLALLERAEAAGLGELDNSAIIRAIQSPPGDRRSIT
jgi:3-hydroxyisobutyrate dehydrogenase-like beta-hydroxyacid dehydrogenase